VRAIFPLFHALLMARVVLEIARSSPRFLIASEWNLRSNKPAKLKLFNCMNAETTSTTAAQLAEAVYESLSSTLGQGHTSFLLKGCQRWQAMTLQS